MKNTIFKKGLVFTIIVLFFGISVAPSITGYDEEVEKTVSIQDGNKSLNMKNNDYDNLIKQAIESGVISNNDWSEQAKLLASDGYDHHRFGWSVSIDGDTAIIGAVVDDSAYIFTRSGTTWTEQAKLLASDGEGDDSFGFSVSINGDTAIIGAPWDDDNGDESGSAYIFKRSGTTWSEHAKLLPLDGAEWDHFGDSVSIDGDYAIIGAPNDNDNGEYSGSAYIFKRDGSSWTEQAKLLASDGGVPDQFGCSVSIDGDTALIGASYDNDNGDWSGSAYIFTRSGTIWTEQAKLLASDGAPIDYFGVSVSIDGEYAIVGAKGDGSAYIFKRSGTTWSEHAKLLPLDGESGDSFGFSVSIDGDYAVIGARYDDDNGDESGSAYIFKRDGSSWTEQAKLLASDGAYQDLFGWSVSIDGDTAIIGVQWDDDNGWQSGSAYVFTRSESAQDLIIEDNWILPTTFSPGDNIFACTIINNSGNFNSRDSGPFNIRWLIDEIPICSKFYDKLPWGRSVASWPPECIAKWPKDFQKHYYTCQLWIQDNLESILIEEFSAFPNPLIADTNGPYYYEWFGWLIPSLHNKIYVPIQFNGDAFGGVEPYTYKWDFGDGDISTEKNPTHYYMIPAWEYFYHSNTKTYYVYLLVEDSEGKQFMDITTVCIGKSPHEPIANAGGPYFAEQGETIYFDGSKSFDPDGGPLTYHWDFGDDIGFSTEANPSYFYPSSGVYTVTLTVMDNQGLIGKDQTVADVGYIIEFTPPDGYENGIGDITNDESEWGSTNVKSWPKADIETGEMSMHLYSAAGPFVSGSAVAGKSEIYGPNDGYFSVLESGNYDIHFILSSSGQSKYYTPTDPLTEGLVFILSAGVSGYLSLIANIVTPDPGLPPSSESYERGITEFYENNILKKAEDLKVTGFMCNFITPGYQVLTWEDGLYDVNYQMPLKIGKSYNFTTGLYIRLACADISGLDAVSREYQINNTFLAFKAMKIPENLINGGGKKSSFNESNIAYIDSSVSKADFLIRWIEGSDLNLTLERPDGFIVDPDVAMSDPNITFISDSTYEMYTIISPMCGEWELLIDEVSVPPGGVDYIARVSGDTSIFTDLYLDKGELKYGACKPGDNILVSLNISDLDEPVTGASVITEIVTPVDVVQLVLYDDGLHNDGLADDGVYANNFTDTSVEGIYNLTSTATGIIDGYQFSRTTDTQAVVMGVSNQPPGKPDLDGPSFGKKNNEYSFEVVSTDPESDKLFYWFDWGDGSNTGWLGPFESGEICTTVHSWKNNGTYAIYVKVMDELGFLGNTSEPQVFYIDHQPLSPIIDGPVNGGINIPHTYEFMSLDEDNDDLYYFVDWDDGTDSGWIGPYKQNETCNLSHEWTKKGTYIIQAKSKDIYGAESDWGILEVTMPRDKAINRPFLRFLENHPKLLSILKLLIQQLGLLTTS